MYGYYVHPEAGPDGEPVVVRLQANPEDRADYAREGYRYLGEAPAPGTSTPEEEEKALARAQAEAARKAAPREGGVPPPGPDAEPKPVEGAGAPVEAAAPERSVPRSARS